MFSVCFSKWKNLWIKKTTMFTGLWFLIRLVLMKNCYQNTCLQVILHCFTNELKRKNGNEFVIFCFSPTEHWPHPSKEKLPYPGNDLWVWLWSLFRVCQSRSVADPTDITQQPLIVQSFFQSCKLTSMFFLFHFLFFIQIIPYFK